MRRLVTVIILGAVLGWIAPGAALAEPLLPFSATTVGCPSAPAVEPAHAIVPPELQALEQKGHHLKLNSVRFSYELVFATPTGTLIVDDTTTGKLSPDESTSILTIRGRSPSSDKSESETRRTLEIGDATYRYEPNVTHGDGGRPWVREHRERSHDGSKSTSFEPSIKQLSEAESILESGTTEINGQQVSQFTVTFAPNVYPRSELPFGELLEKACPEPVQINLALAPSGLPVRVDVSAKYLRSNEAISTMTATEILATNFPFAKLKPPPAKRTISAAALQRLILHRRAKN